MSLMSGNQEWFQMPKNMERVQTAVPARAPSAARSIRDGLRRRLRFWPVTVALMLIAGVVASVLAATNVAGQNADRSKRAFAASAVEIANSLNLAIQRQDDLIISAAGFATGQPDASQSDFLGWTSSVRVLERYPELQGMGYAVVVPDADLAAFAARVVADPSAPLAADGSFQVVPAGDRPYYCLQAFGVARNASLLSPAGFDYCANAAVDELASRDSGQSTSQPFEINGTTWLAITTPVYLGGVTPATLDARRAAFLGWFGVLVTPDTVLNAGVQGHPDIAITLTYEHNGGRAVFRNGTPPTRAMQRSVDLYDGWTVVAFASAPDRSVVSNHDALGVLAGGIAISVLLAALLLVLGTGRARALRFVGVQTGELRHQALHDALTGLPNRVLIGLRIEQLLERNRNNGTAAAALYVDLDEFKNVNDTLGHEAGDRLLQAVAARLTARLRDVDTIGRMGGDEFVVLLDAGSDGSAPQQVAERLLTAMREPFMIDATSLPIIVTTTVGIAIGDRKHPGELLRDADVALYSAKAAGKDCYATFDDRMSSSLQNRYELAFDLRSALDSSQFRLAYQPIYDLNDLTIVGVEVLIRWEHPTRGMIQPDEFIPLLESSSQIIEVGRWVLVEACRQAAHWRDRGSNVTLAVNVSGRQLDRDVVVDHVREALATSGLEPARLTLEVTETALMRDVDTAARRLRALKELGVQLAMDDFGTGYCSLAYLQRFPIDCIKVDRTFVNAITDSPEADALVHTLVQLGKNLGLRILAEGVETTDQIDFLRAEGVNQAQGYLLAHPVSAERLERELLEPTRSTEGIERR